jgi:NADPH:quinone reductase-like Zn-dependent oxidoreductase
MFLIFMLLQVTRFKKGDQVYGYTGLSFGAYAEFTCMTESGVMALKPNNLTYEEAASIPNGALTALVFLHKKAKIKSGDQVLIYGASGSVGVAAVQLAKYFGAQVTGVCSTKNVALIKSLGADKVIDYTKEDFTKSGETYDIIFDTVGKTSLAQGKGSLKVNGCYLLTVFGVAEMIQMIGSSFMGQKRIIGASSNFSWTFEDLDFLRGLIEEGKLKPVVDRLYPLSDVVEAHRYVEEGHKVGNVVLTLDCNKTE